MLHLSPEREARLQKDRDREILLMSLIRAGAPPREIQRQIDRWYDEDSQEPPFNDRPRRPQRPRPLTVAAEQPR